MNKRKQEEWIELAIQACNDAGVAYTEIAPITTWEQTFDHSDNFRNSAVFRLGNQRILKIYGRRSKRTFPVEESVLQTLNHHDDVPCPTYIASGELEGLAPYLIMSEIEGDTLEHTWGSLSRSELIGIAKDIGKITAALHRVPTDALEAVEAAVGGKKENTEFEQAERISEIENLALSSKHKDELLTFLHGEALDFLEVPNKLTHSDFSHAHIYLAQQNQLWQVSAFIDWAEAMLGPAEWDTAFHWFWTFSQDKETMRACLETQYADVELPERFARRCFSTHFYTYSMGEVWDYFQKEVKEEDSIVRQMVESLFPPDVFGSPD